MASGKEIIFKFRHLPSKASPNWKQKDVDEWKAKRMFYSCNGSRNHVNYMKTGSPDEDKLQKNHLDYMEQKNKVIEKGKERSMGLFDRDGKCGEEREQAHREKLKETKGIIWYGVVSFTKGFGESYCYTSDQAENAMKSVLKPFLNHTHLKDRNINWIGALHLNTDNPHIHFTFYEKEPWRVNKNGEKVYTNKGKIEKESFDYVKMSFYKYFQEEAIDIHTLRDKTLERFKEIRADLSRNGSYFNDFKELSRKLKIIDDKPKYESLTALQKNMVDNFSIRLLQTQPELVKEYSKTFAKLKKAERNIQEFANIRNTDSIESKAESFKKDFFKRMGNSILTSCSTVHRVEVKTKDYVKFISDRDRENRMSNKNKSLIRSVKKNFSQVAYSSFKRLIRLDDANEIMKNYKWLDIVAEAEEREDKLKQQQGGKKYE